MLLRAAMSHLLGESGKKKSNTTQRTAGNYRMWRVRKPTFIGKSTPIGYQIPNVSLDNMCIQVALYSLNRLNL